MSLLCLLLVLVASVVPASASKKLSRSNDLSGVLADMDDGNRKDGKSIPITTEMKDEGIELVIHRLTLGRRLFKTVNGQLKDDADDSYSSRAAQAFSSNVAFGAYHVMFPSPTGEDNGVEQARGFLSAIKDRCIAGQELLLAVDWEPTRCGGRSCGTAEPKYLASFIPAVRRVTGKPVVVYTSPDVLEKFSDEITATSPVGQMLRDNPLWLAQYRRDFKFAIDGSGASVRTGFVFPLVEQLAPWDRWTFWQFAASEDKSNLAPNKSVSLTVRSHKLDLSWFAGSRDQFRDFYRANKVRCDELDLSRI
jgi:GH25 family lysozyme M1 (1,4-beta-N-acetylmuramidase)